MKRIILPLAILASGLAVLGATFIAAPQSVAAGDYSDLSYSKCTTRCLDGLIGALGDCGQVGDPGYNQCVSDYNRIHNSCLGSCRPSLRCTISPGKGYC